MLAKSEFFGFEVLMYLLGVHFALVYTVTNYINNGYLLQLDVLLIIFNNLLWDFTAIASALLLVLLQLYLADLLLRVALPPQQKRMLMVAYSSVWIGAFVVAGLLMIHSLDFYFTDRILIVVCSWTLPVKSASYCLDRLLSAPQPVLPTKLKFIMSPLVIYQDFVADHNPQLPIHSSYLLIKSLTATMCLVINYILVTEMIAPYVWTDIHQTMSFLELFFRLTPLLFFEHVCLYYLIMENILLALAEITQLRRRRFFLDWWNAETVSEYLEKWVLLINAFSDKYLPLSRRAKHTIHLTVVFLMLFSVFGEQVTLNMVAFAGINILIFFFLGENRRIQNNYLVHFLVVCFQPFSLAAIIKYRIFS